MTLRRVAGPSVLMTLILSPGRLQPSSLLRPRASAGTSPLRTRFRRQMDRLGPPLWLRPPLSRDDSTSSTLSIHQRKILTTWVRIRSSTTVGGDLRSPTRRGKPVPTFSKPQRGRHVKIASVLTPRRAGFVACCQPSVVLRAERVLGYVDQHPDLPGGSVVSFPGYCPSSLVSSGNCIDRPLPISQPEVPPYRLPSVWPTPLLWPLGLRLILTPTPSPRSTMVRLTRTNGPEPARRFPSMFRTLGISAVLPPDRLQGLPRRHRVGFVNHQTSPGGLVVRSGCAEPNIQCD